MSDQVTAPDGIEVRYETLGSGSPTLVFVHGWSCDRSYWKGQLALAGRHRVVTADLPGHGESGAGRATYSIASFGVDVAAVIDELDLHDAVLIGHSMGGDVILETALLRPERVIGLIWVDTYATLGTPRTAQEVQDFADSFHPDFVERTQRLVRRFFLPTADRELVAWIADDMSSSRPDVAMDVFVHAIGNHGRVLEILPQVRAPLVSINPGYWPADEDALRRHGVRAVLGMPDVGHFPMLEDPDQFNSILVEAVGLLRAQ